MLRLPLSDSPLRELFDVADLANKQWCTLAEARTSARKTFEAHKPGAIRSVYFLVLLAAGDVVLMRVGPRGGRVILWRFGQAPF